MGQDKAQLILSGSTLFERVLETMSAVFPQVIIAGERPDLGHERVPFVPDIYPGSALGGLHTGLSAITTDWMCVVPCDLPFPDTRILETLICHRDDVDAVVPKTSAGYEPVVALYHNAACRLWNPCCRVVNTAFSICSTRLSYARSIPTTFPPPEVKKRS